MLATIPSQHKLGSALDQYKSKNLTTDSVSRHPSHISPDVIDNPLHKQLHEGDIIEDNILLDMKYESNRLFTFKNRWPITEISPKSLAEAGFFYLQQEDRVQCPFCFVTIYNWTAGDKPLREHVRRKPKCPFLIGSNVGNVPLHLEKHQQILSIPDLEKNYSSSATASYKPKHSSMSDIKRRILTYAGWPLSKPSPEELAECGLYYSGIADVVTCFFCGGTLGNWEPQDDPWTEHSKFFPDCSFLSITKRHAKSARIVPKLKKTKEKCVNGLPSSSVSSDIIQQALDIFPKPLVLNALKRKETITSLQELCDDILELKQPSNHEANSVVSAKTNGTSENSNRIPSTDALLCKLCMDQERGVVFQPCGHLICCWKCSNLISDCPVCRSPIIHKIKTYLS